MDKLHERAVSFRARVGRLVEERASLHAELGRRREREMRLVEEIRHSGDELELTEKAAEVTKLLVDRLAEGGVGELSAMLSYGVGAIFEGRGYSVEVEVDDRGKDKTAALWLLDPVGMRTKLYEGNGGGLAAVASLMIRAFLICRFGRRRFLFMDEPMSQLSTDFVPGFLSFLRLLVDELGFVVLMITHDERFVPEADRLYRVEAGRVAEVER